MMDTVSSDPALARWLRAHELAAFFILTFLITFAGWLPLIFGLPGGDIFNVIGLWGPALAGVIVTAAARGRAGLADLWRRMGLWRAPLRWYLVILLAWPALALLAAVIHAALTGQALAWQWDHWEATLGWLFNALVLGFWACEEIGWRGVALPRLLERWNALAASAILGLVWAAWHLPYYLIGAMQVPFYVFALNTVALSILMTWVYQHTQGSLFIATLLHFWVNVYAGFQAERLPLLDPGGLETVQDVLLAVVAVVVMAVYGYHSLARDVKNQKSEGLAAMLDK